MDLIIVGAGSVGGHISQNLKEYNQEFNLLGFVDDDPQKQGGKFLGYPVLGPVDLLLNLKNIAVVIGIAFPRVKSKIIEKLSYNTHLTFPSLISSRAWVSNGIMIGKGVIIYPGVAINYGSIIGDYVVMNMNCAIGHNCVIGKYSSLAPGVNFAGHTYIGTGVEVGIGTSSKQQVEVGDYAVVGGQTMLIHDVPRGATVVGIPAKEVEYARVLNF